MFTRLGTNVEFKLCGIIKQAEEMLWSLEEIVKSRSLFKNEDRYLKEYRRINIFYS